MPLSAHVLTNIEGIHALTAWRRYNQGAVIEQRIAELGLLWGLGLLAYQFLHILRTTALSGSWRTAQPRRLRLWLFRLPGRLTRHARPTYPQLLNTEPARARLLLALQRMGGLPPPVLA